MYLIMKQVLIKVFRSIKNFVDILNYKFDEVFLILEETVDILRAQALTVDAYDNLSKMVNLSF